MSSFKKMTQEEILKLETKLRAYNMKTITPLPIEAAMLVFSNLIKIKGNGEGGLTEEEIGMIITKVTGTSEWKKTVEPETPADIKKMDAEKVFAQGLTEVVNIDERPNVQAAGYIMNANVGEHYVCSAVASNKKTARKSVKMEVVAVACEYYNAFLPCLDVKKMGDPKTKEEYGLCNVCNFPVRLEGHAARCNPGNSSGYIASLTGDPRFALAKLFGDILHRFWALEYIAILGKKQYTVELESYVRQEHQSDYLKSIKGKEINATYSEHTIADCFEFLFVTDREFCKKYCESVGFIFHGDQFDETGKNLHFHPF